MIYELDQKHFKAKIYLTNSRANHFIIPRMITYQDEKYSIMKIGHTETNYSINSITFSENCEIKSIDLNDINCYRLKQFNIPPSVEKIRLNDSSFLNNITISRKNRNFKWTNDGLLLGKTDLNSNDFDVIFFARKNIEKIFIPSNIKRIEDYCFYLCLNAEEIEFEKNSQLQFIGNSAFAYNRFKTISIPQHVRKICDHAFYKCKLLQKVDFLPFSELESIGNYAFNFTSIESFKNPKNVKSIGDYAFYKVKQLQKIEFNSELNYIGDHSFASTSIETLLIPQKVTTICDYAFYKCNLLRSIEFDSNSELNYIGRNAFSFSIIESIYIPKHVKKIRNRTF